MTSRMGRAFQPTLSFNTTAGSSGLYSIAASSDWTGPSNRSIRLATMDSSSDFYVQFGTSTVVAASSNSVLMLGGTVEAFYLTPSQTYLMVYSSTTITVNVTAGYGA